jgi:hypothetical protein
MRRGESVPTILGLLPSRRRRKVEQDERCQRSGRGKGGMHQRSRDELSNLIKTIACIQEDKRFERLRNSKVEDEGKEGGRAIGRVGKRQFDLSGRNMEKEGRQYEITNLLARCFYLV